MTQEERITKLEKQVDELAQLVVTLVVQKEVTCTRSRVKANQEKGTDYLLDGTQAR